MLIIFELKIEFLLLEAMIFASGGLWGRCESPMWNYILPLEGLAIVVI